MRFVAGVFLVVHGLVHLLYVGQSTRTFELQPGMAWPDGSWLLSSLSSDTVRLIASATYVVAALAFVSAGAGVLAGQGWWRNAAIVSAIFATPAVVLFWDGTAQRLSDQGLIAIMINIAILAAVLWLGWPNFDF